VYLVAIAWLYVALMMAVAEATHPAGTLLGAIVTFLFYGLLPTALVMYVMGTPLRRKARLAQEARALEAARTVPSGIDATPHPAGETASPAPIQPDASGHAPGTPQARSVPPV
jgi:hypothetical protein